MVFLTVALLRQLSSRFSFFFVLGFCYNTVVINVFIIRTNAIKYQTLHSLNVEAFFPFSFQQKKGSNNHNVSQVSYWSCRKSSLFYGLVFFYLYKPKLCHCVFQKFYKVFGSKCETGIVWFLNIRRKKFDEGSTNNNKKVKTNAYVSLVT